MCGITGVFAYDARTARADRGAVERACQHMSCRGPDDEGLWKDADGRMVLGHRRLAIIDLTARAAQLMHSADERYVMVFNGVIYNYRALRIALEAKGRRFTSDSDTEVLLQLYAERGSEMVHDLRGMFAPWELPTLMDPDIARIGWRQLDTCARQGETIRGLATDRFRITALESSWYMRSQLLRDTDWTSMTHGVEIRVPYVDVPLWQTLAPRMVGMLPFGKDALARTPRMPLPPRVVPRAKTGFTTPVQSSVAKPEASRTERGLRGWAKRVYSEHLAHA